MIWLVWEHVQKREIINSTLIHFLRLSEKKHEVKFISYHDSKEVMYYDGLKQYWLQYCLGIKRQVCFEVYLALYWDIKH